MNREFDIVVTGGGSGGIAAAFRAAESGARVALVEPEELFGGTSTNGWVNCWEPVADADGFPRLLYDRMRRTPLGCGIYTTSRHHFFMTGAKAHFPGAEQRIDPELNYADTLKAGWDYQVFWQPRKWNGVIFEPRVFDLAARELLLQAGCELYAGRRVTGIEKKQRSITAAMLDNGTGLSAPYWIDNSGVIAQLAGCEILYGREARSEFHESGAPETAEPGEINGVTLIFRIARKSNPAIDPLPAGMVADGRYDAATPAYMVATEYPNGDFHCNMLPTMIGAEFSRMDEASALAECRRRVYLYFRWLQEAYPEFRSFRIAGLAPRLGIRESFRVRCRWMLNENDLLAGWQRQGHADMVVYADHPMDTHGRHGGDRLTLPYGIPYRSLLPERVDNLLLAGRIAGFSSLAASSCRLARTMMRLGEAAGYAAALAWSERGDVAAVDMVKLQELTGGTAWIAKAKKSSSPAAAKVTATALPKN